MLSHVKLLGLALLCASLPGISLSDTTKTTTIETSNGPVRFTTTPVPPFPQEVVAASIGDIAQFNANVVEAYGFVRAFLPMVEKPTMQDFDVAFARWQKEGTRRYSEERVVELLGAYLGSRLVADVNMEWVVVNDQYGRDFAVRAKNYEALSFPFAVVAKRIQKNEYDFMVGVYEALRYSIKNGEVKRR